YTGDFDSPSDPVTFTTLESSDHDGHEITSSDGVIVPDSQEESEISESVVDVVDEEEDTSKLFVMPGAHPDAAVPSVMSANEDMPRGGGQPPRTRYVISEDGRLTHPVARPRGGNNFSNTSTDSISGPRVFIGSFPDHQVESDDEHDDEIDESLVKGNLFKEVYERLPEGEERSLISKRLEVIDSAPHSHELIQLNATHVGASNGSVEDSDQGDRQAPTYEQKGKGREPGTRPAETEQIEKDRKLANRIQAKEYSAAEGESSTKKRSKRKKKAPSDASTGDRRSNSSKGSKKKSKPKELEGLEFTRYLINRLDAPQPAPLAQEVVNNGPSGQLPARSYLTQALRIGGGAKKKKQEFSDGSGKSKQRGRTSTSAKRHKRKAKDLDSDRKSHKKAKVAYPIGEVVNAYDSDDEGNARPEDTGYDGEDDEVVKKRRGEGDEPEPSGSTSDDESSKESESSNESDDSSDSSDPHDSSSSSSPSSSSSSSSSPSSSSSESSSSSSSSDSDDPRD
ncbi:hypothetical protein M407DRAFT_234042, partial [Tulasnella calospora MUT 4182]